MLDRFDRKILELLQRDSNQSTRALAEQVSLSVSACAERVKKLERSGLIKGYQALLNADALGQNHIVFVEVTLNHSDQSVFKAFAQAVQARPEVQSCHMVAGGFDYLLKVRGRDIHEYRQFLGDVLTQLPDVRSTHTYVVMETIKDQATLAIQQG